MRKLLNLLLTAMCMLLLAGCSGQEQVKTETKDAEDRLLIGMSFDSFVIERWQRDRDVFVSVAKELGADVDVQNANGDLEEQKNQIDYFIKKGVDAIVVICIDADGLKDSIKRAKDAGIIIVAYDRLVKNANVDLYITFDNAMVGTMMARSIATKLPEGGRVLMLGGSTTDNNVTIVENAFRKECERNDLTIVDVYHADGWLAELAGEYVRSHMELVEQVDAIMCGNDDLASMVVPALAEKRIAGEKLVVGQDADLLACQRIVEGTQLMTVYKPVEKLARKAVECTIALLKGEELPADSVSTMNDGTYDVPYVGLTPLSVDENNIDEIIIGNGFHLKEDVYLNVPSKMPGN